MNKTKIKCEICFINDAQVKDHRNIDGIYNKYLVCANCFMLNDLCFFRLKWAKEEKSKKRVMAQITGGEWKDYIII